MPLGIVHNGAVTTRFVYDGEGVRAKKTVSGGSTTYYIGEHFEIKDGVATRYIFAGNRRVAKRTGDEVYFYHKDHLGSSTVMTDGSAGQVEYTDYLPFGHQREHTGSSVANYKYTDQELDPSTGLYNYDARLYDPVVGRFISADSIVPDWYDPQSLNRYSYALNNPLKYIDPTGHQSSIAAPEFGMMPPYYDTPQMQEARERDVLRLTQWLKSRYNEDAVLAIAWRYYKGLFQQSEKTEDIEDETKSKTQQKKEEKRRKKQEQSEPKDPKATKDKATKEKKKIYQERKDDLDYQIDKEGQLDKRNLPKNKTEQNIEKLIDDYEK